MTEQKPGRGLAVVISGPSGAGKSTLARRLVERYGYAVSVSATTRPPREGERDGAAYHFWDRARFVRAAESGELLEWSEHFENLYGTPAAAVRDALAAGNVVLLEIDVNGAKQVMENLPEAFCIFVTAPDMREVERRLRGRHSETQAAIRVRLQRADMEMARQIQYNAQVVNADLEQTVEKIHALIQAQVRGRDES